MQKVKSNKIYLLQLFSIPFLFVQYLFSFAIAAFLKFFFKPESLTDKDIHAEESQSGEIDPQVLHVIDELGTQEGVKLAGSTH